MVSKFEVLEYIRVHGIASLKELRQLFGSQVHFVVMKLQIFGLVKKFTLRRVKIGNDYYVKKVYLSRRERKYPTYFELTPLAYEYLRKFGVNSFYDLPYAKIIEKERIKRPFVKFGDWL